MEKWTNRVKDNNKLTLCFRWTRDDIKMKDFFFNVCKVAPPLRMKTHTMYYLKGSLSCYLPLIALASMKVSCLICMAKLLPIVLALMKVSCSIKISYFSRGLPMALASIHCDLVPWCRKITAIKQRVRRYFWLLLKIKGLRTNEEKRDCLTSSRRPLNNNEC